MKPMRFKPKTMLVPCIGWNIQITVLDWSMESRDLKGGVEYLSTTTTERRPRANHSAFECREKVCARATWWICKEFPDILN